MKYAELLASQRFRFFVVGQVFILKVTLALSVTQAASFDAFTSRHDLSKNVQRIYLSIFVGVWHRPKAPQSCARQNHDQSIQILWQIIFHELSRNRSSHQSLLARTFLICKTSRQLTLVL